MGLNAYLEAAGAVGYTTGTTAAGAWVTIDGKPGKRIAIQTYDLNPRSGGTATVAYIQHGREYTTITSTGGASNATTITVNAFTTAPATGATFVVVLDDGTYQWLTVASTASTTSVPISSALTDSAHGNAVYDLGVYNATGNPVINVANTNTSNQAYGSPGLFFGKFKGCPMRIGLINAAASLSATVDYVTYGYINV